MNFSSNITKLRKEANLSQQEVADSIGMARATYAGLEINKRPPNLDEIRNISNFYQIDPINLISEEHPEMTGSKKLQTLSYAKDTTTQITYSTPSEFEKFRAVFLYILEKIGAKPNVGETVIYKIMYFIDFDFYEKTRRSITGTQYVHNHYGPTPVKRDYDIFIKKLVDAGDIVVVTSKRFTYQQKKYLPNKTPDLSAINGEELAHIDFELDRLGNKSRDELTSLSHKDMPWLATKQNELIDYQLAMYRTPVTSVKLEDEDN